MKIKTPFRAVLPGQTRHYGSSLLALEAAQKYHGKAEHHFGGEWVQFTKWPIQERLDAQQAGFESRWREGKSYHPYGMTEAGWILGVDLMHATGLPLLDLEKLGLLME